MMLFRSTTLLIGALTKISGAVRVSTPSISTARITFLRRFLAASAATVRGSLADGSYTVAGAELGMVGISNCFSDRLPFFHLSPLGQWEGSISSRRPGVARFQTDPLPVRAR